MFKSDVKLTLKKYLLYMIGIDGIVRAQRVALVYSIFYDITRVLYLYNNYSSAKNRYSHFYRRRGIFTTPGD
jgi:hypothetical protein